ncbi:casein kinase delta [Fusarium sp. NRRL 25303]|nr:casein kinase delta [Fusarium sp. NRRL 25303]
MPATATSDSDEPMMTRKRRRAAPNRNGEPFQQTAPDSLGEDSRKRTAYTVGEAWEFDRILEVSRAYDGRLMYKIAWQPTWGRISDFESDDAIDAARWAVISTFGTEDWDAEYQPMKLERILRALIEDVLNAEIDFAFMLRSKTFFYIKVPAHMENQ